MTVVPTDKKEFLASLRIFEDLTDEEVEALAEIAPEYTYDADVVIAYQGDLANSLYIVHTGRLFASTVDERGIVRERRVYEAGEFFGEEWLFKADQHTATVRATDPGRLIIIQGKEISRLLKENPEMVKGLEPGTYQGRPIGLIDEAWVELTEQIEGVAVEEEKVVFQTRRSGWVLVAKAGLRSLILAGYIGLYWWLAAGLDFLRSPFALAFFFAAPVLFLSVWLIIAVLDWLNDYFVITQRHIVHYDFSLSLTKFGRSDQRTPLERIQSINFLRPNILFNLLRIGTIRVTTGAFGGTGVVEFDKIPRPDRVQQVLEGQREMAREVAQKVDVSRTQTTIRQAVEGHFQIQSPYQIVLEEAEGEEEEGTNGTPQTTTRMGAGLVTRPASMTEVVYRKSRVFLLLQMKWGLLLLAGAIGGLIVLGQIAFNPICWSSWALYFAFSLLVLLYEFLDWYNDQYILTDRFVIDIDKLPFGLSTSQTQAELMNIQNVTVKQAGIIANIFSYGDVIIETAGATADIVFERVTKPREVQKEILRRQELQQQRRARREEEQRLEEMAVFLDVYQQISEQKQIPRRTMDPTEVETQRRDPL